MTFPIPSMGLYYDPLNSNPCIPVLRTRGAKCAENSTNRRREGIRARLGPHPLAATVSLRVGIFLEKSWYLTVCGCGPNIEAYKIIAHVSLRPI